MRERLAIGCMSGTSVDGLDLALVRARGTGLDVEVELVETLALPLGALGQELFAFARGAALTAQQCASLARRFGALHGEGCVQLARGRLVALIAVHGQTVAHAPPDSWQLVNPWVIAQRTGAPVVFDLRGADLAAGGEGAPITPLADLVVFGDAERSRAIVNLGGFANATLLPRVTSRKDALDGVRGADVVPCNHWLDGLSRALLDAPFDAHGAHAARGTPNAAVVARFTEELAAIRVHARSMGSAHEQPRLRELAAGVSADDALASAVDAVARALAETVHGCDEVLLAGGSVRNLALVRALERHCTAPVFTTAHAGVDPLWREALEMAVLGLLSQDGVPITLPAVTGALRAPLAGAWCTPSGARPR